MGRSQDVMVTNDGATILKSLYVDNPAAKVLVGNQVSLMHMPQTACCTEAQLLLSAVAILFSALSLACACSHTSVTALVV